MQLNKTRRALTAMLMLAMLFSMFASTTASASPSGAPSTMVSFTILHTNDFHGQLEAAGTNPGSARVATYVESVRTAVGASNVLLVDAGDQMQGSLLSNMGDGTATGKGMYTMSTYNAMGYDVATFGNHEFDWGQQNLLNRTTDATYPYVTANIVKMTGADCASTTDWVKPDFADAPYQIETIGTAPDAVNVAFIGVTTTETPTITIASATAGLCFKDPAASIIHYYDEMKTAGADVIVVLSHLGNTDAGGGYGLPVYGDQTLATKLNAAGKPVNLIIGGHSHTDLTAAQTVGSTKVVQASSNGMKVGRANITVDTAGVVTIDSVSDPWTSNPTAALAQEPAINALISGPWDSGTNTGGFANNPTYLTLVNAEVGYSAVDLPRNGRIVDNMMSTFVDDAIYNYLNTDAESANDIDIFINNGGGIRTALCWNGALWVATTTDAGCVAAPATHAAGLLTYGNMFAVLPFGNATIVGTMTGAQILEVLNHGPEIPYVAQPAGLKYKYYKYTDSIPSAGYVWAWGAFDVTVKNKSTGLYEPLDLTKTYKVGTNEFLAPGGGDGYNAFKYMQNVTSWGDMLNAVNAYVKDHYTLANPYMGPNGDGSLDNRILRDGTATGGSIIPVTILHHNDMHGNLAKGAYVGYTQLATLIKQERQHNPNRTLLLNSGDDIQGDALTFFYKSSYSGFAVDGSALAPSLQTNPVMAVMNSMNYDAMTLGNHEFNFGKDVFRGVLGQATFPVLQANVTDDGGYGLSYATGGAGVKPYVLKNLNPGVDDIKVAILGIGNHRIPNYELPSNIPGLTFTNPLTKAQELSTSLRSSNDVVLALTHIGFTENPNSVEVDANVDTNMAATVTGLDAIVGGHSHTDPSKKNTNGASGNYQFLPSMVGGPNNTPVIIGQAYRYNNTLGEIVIGLRKVGGVYEVVSRAGKYLSVTSGTAEDAATKAIVDPYLTPFNTYNNTGIGSTTAPIDTMAAFTQETNGANLQADASVYELETKNSIPVDFHLSGAMTNKLVANTATLGSPYSLKISDMFSAMPYENSLVVINMNGPQIKTVLERAYRNYYYYKYVPLYGGYSYYTTCMLDTNAGNQIVYNEKGTGTPPLPDGNNVVAFYYNGTPIDFTDASTYYKVSTVNYLAAGSCNFNNSGTTLWPLDQIANDTQYYVRDAVIDYVTHEVTVSPAVEGRLYFTSDTTAPVVSVPSDITLEATGLTGAVVTYANGTATDETLPATPAVTCLPASGSTFSIGAHTVTCTAKDFAGNTGSNTFTVTVTDNMPTVNIVRADTDNTSAAVVHFEATFSEPVTDVDVADFKLTNTLLFGASITGVSGSVDTYTITVNTGNGNGTIRLDVPDTATIHDSTSNLVAAYTDGEFYTIDKGVAPTVPVLKTPLNGALVPDLDYMPTLDWNDSSLVMALAGTPGWHYDVNVTAVGYDQTFSTQDDPDPAVGLSNSEYTFDTPLAANTTFTWKVRSCNDANQCSAWSAPRTFRTKLATPVLNLPADDPTAIHPLNNIRPTFEWDQVPGATAYTIQVFKVGVAVPVVNVSISATRYTYTPSFNLVANAVYKWRVKADGINQGNYSGWFTFKTAVSSPSVPVLVAPLNGAILPQTVTPTRKLDWNPSTGTPISYDIEYANNSTFTGSTYMFTNLPSATTELLIVTKPGRTYFWRVRAWNAAGNHSAWSPVYNFKVKFAVPLLGTVTDNAGGRPTFTWTSNGNGIWTSFTIVVAKNAAFTVGVRAFNVSAPFTTYTVPAALPRLAAGDYYWKVRINGSYVPVFSAPSPTTFTIAP